ncbi:SIS domain-containing protein [Bordetella sp. FB-8]|uniref:SIS domain-containing protein n=1 Tax=Bordetella sp. FB-8 TaxID=1159870 RepID=UPI000379A7DC|nr:SIS domain-containing protein [Bordetella sp. FB-8]
MLDRIKSQHDSLSAAERKVSQLVLGQPNQVIQATVADIAMRAGVSQPTVIRFCRSLGCTGLPDFKLKLAGSLVAGVPYVHSSVRPGDPTSEISAKVFDNAVSALLKCRNDVSPAMLDAAIALLAKARRIEFYGLGNSGIIAADAQHKFFRFDIPAVSYADPHVQAMAASLLGPRDVLVAISTSGRSSELLDAVEIARSNRCPVVAITSSGTPLARLATVPLLADTQEDTEIYSPMLSRIVHLVMIDVLAVGVALKHGPGLSATLEKTKRSLKRRRHRADA